MRPKVAQGLVLWDYLQFCRKKDEIESGQTAPGDKSQKQMTTISDVIPENYSNPVGSRWKIENIFRKAMGRKMKYSSKYRIYFTYEDCIM